MDDVDVHWPDATRKRSTEGQEKPLQMPPRKRPRSGHERAPDARLVLFTNAHARDHQARCTDPRKCPCCHFIWNRREFQKRFPMMTDGTIINGIGISAADLNESNRRLAKTSWVEARIDGNGVFGIGCLACSANPDTKGRMRAFSKFEVRQLSMLKVWHLKRHAENPLHKLNVLKLLGVPLGPNCVPVDRSPPVEQFAKVLAHVREGRAFNGGILDVGKKDKLQRMTFCLFEAVMRIDRASLGKAESISLRRDESKGHLFIRFACVDKNFTLRVGLFDSLYPCKPGATECVAATRVMMKKVSTKNLGAPNSKVKKLHLKPLNRHIRNTTRQMITDAASYERLACRKQYEGVNHDDRDVLTPNLRVSTLDMMHRSGRALSRTFAVDEYLDSIRETFLWSKFSIVQLIDNSVSLREHFVGEVNRMEAMANAPLLRTLNLHSAKHRAHCIQKTLGELVSYVEAFISTADFAVHDRAGRAPAKHAQQFLDEIAEEPYLQAGMMADAADEIMMFKEYVDTEQMEVCNVAMELSSVKERLRELFSKGLCTDMGYTALALRTLAKGRLIRKTVGLTPFGGDNRVPHEMLLRCQNRMKSWAAVTLQLLEAEFPDFEVTLALRVFSLRADRRGRDQSQEDEARKNAELQQCLSRLCTTYSLDLGDCWKQYHMVRPIAQKLYLDKGLTSLKAWAAALKAVRAHPTDQLCALVMEAIVHGGATSAVEQNFSKIVLKFGKERRRANPELKRWIFKLMLSDPTDDDVINAAAQEVWAEHYHAHRRPSERYCVNRKRKSTLNPFGAAFVRKRREEVTKALAAGPRRHDAEVELPVWTEKHEKEMRFNKEKLHNKMCQAVLDGQIADEEIDDKLLEQCEDYKSHQEECDRKRELEQRAKNEKSAGGRRLTPEELKGQCVFVDADVKDDSLIVALQDRGLVHVSTRKAASLFIVRSPAEASRRILLRAVLVGGYVATASAILQGRGTALQYKPALAMKRNIWISQSFRDRFIAETEILEASIRYFAGSRWKAILGDEHCFKAALTSARRAGKGAEVLGLVTSREQDRGVCCPYRCRQLPHHPFKF